MQRSALVIQAALAVICAGMAWFVADSVAALAAGYGGLLAFTNSYLLAKRVERAGELAKSSPTQGVYALYLGAVQRFVLVLVALGIGMGLLKLPPGPMLAGFAVTLAGHLVTAGRQALSVEPERKQKSRTG